MGALAVNHRYVLAFAQNCKARILDYGCGSGQIVRTGLSMGLDIYGADVFYEGAHDWRRSLQEDDLLGDRIRVIEKHTLPFPNDYFGLVVHNQVLEHVADLEGVLSEIARVLTPGGQMLSLFPSREVLREGHCGIPLSHRFERSSKLRYQYMLTMRKIGFGSYHDGKPPEAWARDFIDWLDRWCYYRPMTSITRCYASAGFSFESREVDYAVFRLNEGDRSLLARIAKTFPLLTTTLVRRLGGLVILSSKG